MKTITYLSIILILIISTVSFAQRVSQTKTGTIQGDPPTDVLNERTMIGFAASDNFGNAVSEAGDVNGDGYDDVIVGAIFNDANGSSSGRAYIYFGGMNFNVAPDVILTGDSTLTYFGCSVSGAGDVNGDGFDDVIVGAYRASGFKGRAYVFYGGASMNSVPDVTLFGIATNDNFGYSVSRAGDVNGDGYSDVIVGAYGHALSAGRAYIYFGSSSMNNVVDKVMTGAAGSAYFGFSVSNAGDVNADGFADVIIGSSGYSSATGRAYIFLGGSSMDTVVDVTMTGQAVGSQFGTSVSSAGDVNRDGYTDVVIGAPVYNSSTGRAYVYYGGAIMNSSSDRIFDGEDVSDNFGYYLSETGDINGDGYSDIVICADDHNGGAGRAYVYKGGPTIDNIPDKYLNGENASDNFGSFASTAGDVNGDGYADFIIGADLNDDNGSSAGKAYLYINSMSGNEVEDIVFDGDFANDNFGNSVSSAGDVNGDGFDDILVGAKGNDQSGAGSGRCYLFLGGTVLSDSADFTFATGAAGDAFGISVAKAGDVNGDGYDDIIMGAYLGNFLGDNAGSAYIYFGSASFNVSVDVSLHGPVAGDQFGYSVSSAGDVNGDGYSDVIVGSPTAGTNDGKAYIFFGGASMNNVADVTISGSNDSELGYSVSTAGDVNGDGYDDVICGLPQSTNGNARIYFGGFSMNSVSDVLLSGETANDDFGISVANAGDMNGDGFGDVIVGAYFNERAAQYAGSSYIYYGGFLMNDSADVILSGPEQFDYFGNTVASAGDLNNDGFGDVMIGMLDESPTFYRGTIFIYHGGPAMDLIPDITMSGNAFEDFYGWPCANAGDVNKDGKNDLIVGSYGYSGIATKAGRVYLYLNTTPQVVPALSSVKDVPFDQGGKVKLKWHKSGYDTRNNSKVTHYNIYRSDPPGTIGYQWEEIGSVNATFQSLYAYTANTNYDSTGNTSGVFYFKVIARTSSAVEMWESNIMSGYSVDNLAPFAPQNLSGVPDNNSIYLTWNENTEEDFHHYIIYRDGVEEYTTDVNNFDDVSVMNDSTYDYRVAAVDVHGNISQQSNLVMVTFNSSTTLNLSVIMEGFYNQPSDEMSMSDTVTVYLRSASAPYPIIDFSKAVIDKNTFTGTFPMNAPTGNYYVTIKHRNSIETWSSLPVSFISGSTNNYSFIDALAKAFGNNMTQVSVAPQRFAIYSGDVNQDGTIDGSDLQLIDNDAFNFQTGYLSTDVNGDDFVDGSDAAVTDNNATNFVSKITP